MMKNIKLYAAATTLAVVTATVSLTAAPPEAQAAEQQVAEVDVEQAAALPAIAVVAAVGLVGAFALGVAQGYMEAKNAQQGTTQPEQQSLANISTMEFDYVLN